MKEISTNKAPAAVGPYSQAISANGLLASSCLYKFACSIHLYKNEES